MRTTKIRLAIGSAALVGSGLLVGAALMGGGATAADGTTGSGSNGTSQTRPAPHEHTAATAAETTKVKAAVKSYDSTITVTTVRKDPDGSFDVDGTKAGQLVALDVSKDLKTITERKGGPGGHGGPGGQGGPGGHEHTAATADETAKVTEAVKGYDSTITVEDVRKDADGSFDVFGTEGDEKVMLEVSKDLKTITERTGGPGQGGPGGHGGPRDGRGPGAPADQGSESGSESGSSSSTTPSAYNA